MTIKKAYQRIIRTLSATVLATLMAAIWTDEHWRWTATSLVLALILVGFVGVRAEAEKRAEQGGAR